MALKFYYDPAGTLTTDLAAYWNLNEAEGSRYDLINPGSGPAALFVAANQERLNIADNTSLSVGDIDFSFSAWIYLTDNIDERVILSKGNSNNSNTIEYRIHFTGSAGTNRFRFGIGNGSANAGVLADSLGAPSLNTWYFIVAWHDSVANTINIQVDNGTVDSTSTSIGSFDSAFEFVIGDYANIAPNSPWDGRIHLLGFWKKVLTTGERTSLYNSGNGLTYPNLTGSLLTSLISYWNLHEGNGTRLDSHGTNDLADNNTVGQAQGVDPGNIAGDNNTVGQAAGVSSITQTAAQFVTANSEYLTVPDNTFISVGNVDFTIAVWAYLDSKAADMRIFEKGAAADEYGIDYRASTDRYRFLIAAGALVVSADNFGSPATGAWHLIVAWHDAANDLIGIQVNNGTANTAATAGVGPIDSTRSLVIGAGENVTTTVVDFLDGRADEAGFWRRVLTTDEKTALYNAGSGNTLINFIPQKHAAFALFD